METYPLPEVPIVNVPEEPSGISFMNADPVIVLNRLDQGDVHSTSLPRNSILPRDDDIDVNNETRIFNFSQIKGDDFQTLRTFLLSRKGLQEIVRDYYRNVEMTVIVRGFNSSAQYKTSNTMKIEYDDEGQAEEVLIVDRNFYNISIELLVFTEFDFGDTVYEPGYSPGVFT